MLTLFLFLVCITIAYLVGSICSAVIVCRLFDLPDPRLEGSKNPGTTNVLRLAGKQYAIVVLLADMLKGLLPVLLASMLGASTLIIGFTCLAAVVGHMYPIFFDFKGGKGVATALGAILGFNFLLGVIVIATWLVVANFFRYASLASIVAIMLAPIASLPIFKSSIAFLPLMFIALLILYKHRDNISRLVDGQESKISFRHKAHHAPVKTTATEAGNQKTSTSSKRASTKRGKKPAISAKKPPTQHQPSSKGD